MVQRCGFIDEFLSALVRQMPLLDAEQRGRELYGAVRFSPFDYVDKKETALSRLVADLLDPSASHGQGPLFLNAFLREIGHEEVSRWKPDVTVNCEDSGENGRIDIVVTTPRSVIGIENKPYAPEGDRQLERYVEEVGKRAGGRQWDVVFLSQREPEPETARDRVIRMGFVAGSEAPTHLSGVLAGVLGAIKAERFASFVREFMDWLERKFGETDISELYAYTDHVMEYFGQDENSRKAIGAVIASQQLVHDKVLDRIGRAVADRLRSIYPDIQVAGVPLSKSISRKGGGFWLRRKEWVKGCTICVQAQTHSYNNVFYGIVGLSPLHSDAATNPGHVCNEHAQLLEGASGNLPGGRSTDWWPWYRTHPSSVWSSEWVGRLLVESNGAPEQHPEILTMIDELAVLAEFVDDYSLSTGSQRSA